MRYKPNKNLPNWKPCPQHKQQQQPQKSLRHTNPCASNEVDPLRMQLCALSGGGRGPGRPWRTLSIFQLESSLQGKELRQGKNSVTEAPWWPQAPHLQSWASTAKGLNSLTAVQFCFSGTEYSRTDGHDFTIFELWSTRYFVECLKKKNRKPNLAETWTLSQGSSIFPLQEQCSKMNQHECQN